MNEETLVCCLDCTYVDFLDTDDYGLVPICSCQNECDGYDLEESKLFKLRPYYKES